MLFKLICSVNSFEQASIICPAIILGIGNTAVNTIKEVLMKLAFYTVDFMHF